MAPLAQALDRDFLGSASGSLTRFARRAVLETERRQRLARLFRIRTVAAVLAVQRIELHGDIALRLFIASNGEIPHGAP